MPDGNFSQAAAIAMNGPTIVGTWGNNITGPIHGIIWQGKKMMDFGPIARTSSSRLNDINENLEAVGWIGTSFNDASAVVYNHSSGEIFNLGPIPAGSRVKRTPLIVVAMSWARGAYWMAMVT